MERRETFAQELCDILVKNKTITESESQAMHKSFKDSEHEYFDQFLLSEGLVEKTDLLRALSQYYKVPSFDVCGYFFNTSLLRQYSKDFLVRNAIIPLELDNDDMLVAIASEPEAPGLESGMRSFASYDVEYLVGLRQEIVDAIREYYDQSPALDVEQEDMSMDEEQRLEKDAINKDEEIEELTYGNVLYRDDEDLDR